jgi:Polysaccharide lyase
MKNNCLTMKSLKTRVAILLASAGILSLASCTNEGIEVPDAQNDNISPSSQRIQSLNWSADPNLTYTDSFYRLSVEPGENASVSTTNDATYGKVWAVNKPSGSKRAELSQTDPSTGSRAAYVPSEGSKVYIGWRWKVNIAGTGNPTSGFAVFQNKSNNKSDGSSTTQNYPFNLEYDGTTLTLATFVPGTGSQSSRRTERWSRAIGENQWLAIVIGVKFSKNSSIGTLELWANGTKQNLVGDNSSQILSHRTLDDFGNYFKWGAYSEAARPFNITAYLDNMKVATTYDEARP